MPKPYKVNRSDDEMQNLMKALSALPCYFEKVLVNVSDNGAGNSPNCVSHAFMDNCFEQN